MSFLDDILGFTAEKFRNQNQNVANTFNELRKTGKLTKGFVGSVPASGLGTISPQMWAQLKPELKAGINQLADQAPGFFEKILKDPRELLLTHMPTDRMPGALGQVSRVNPNRNILSVREDQLKSGQSLLDTLMHEFQHTLNIDRFANMPKEDAATIGTLLKEEMERGGLRHPSLGSRIHELQDASVLHPQDPISNLKLSGHYGISPEEWKSLGPAERAKITTSLPEAIGSNSPKLGYEVFGYGKNEPYGDFLHRVVGDEALAHLSERTNVGRYADQGLTQYPFSDSDRLLDLANNLGVGHGGFSPEDYMQAAKFPLEELTPAIKDKLKAAYESGGQ